MPCSSGRPLWLELSPTSRWARSLPLGLLLPALPARLEVVLDLALLLLALAVGVAEHLSGDLAAAEAESER